MLKAILFDMDETLLNINLNAFILKVCRQEAQILSEISRKNQMSILKSFGSSLWAMIDSERTDDMINFDFFVQDFKERSGIPLDDPVIAEAITYYEQEVLPLLNDRSIDAHPKHGGYEALTTALAHGYKVALFTDPGFSEQVCRARMKWAGIEEIPFERITFMENSTRCKPSGRYYYENIAALGLSPEEVLMVGNDPKRDFIEPGYYLQTAYVGGGDDSRATWCGDMKQFAPNFERIVEAFEIKAEHHRNQQLFES